jgi:DNA-directed RNA polymerase specialized sigma24 family protein
VPVRSRRHRCVAVRRVTPVVPRTARPGTDDGDALARELHAMLTALVERSPLFADLRRQGIAEDLVQDTLIAVTRRMWRGDAIEDPRAYAARCVTNLAKRTYIRGARELATSDVDLEALGPAGEDVADRVHQRMTMSEVLDMVRSVNTVIAALDPLELELVRAELARTDQKHLAATLGISRPTLYRRKGPAIAAFVTAVAQRAGTSPCTEHLGALLAAAGDSGFGAARAAVAHAEDCDACRETIRHLTVARHGLAVIAPVPLIVQPTDPAGAVDRTVAALHAAGEWIRNLVLRTGDPTPFGGSAAKTAAIVAAACTGGGGVYCAVDGIPGPLKAPFTHDVARQAAPGPAAPRRLVATAGTIQPSAQVIAQVASAVRVVEAADARRRARARARQAAARRRAQTVREFAQPTLPATHEFTTPPPAASTITRREFATPAPKTPAQREFGAP